MNKEKIQETLEEEFIKNSTPSEINNIFRGLNEKLDIAVRQYDEVVKQNKSLQTELKEIKNIELQGPLTIRELLLMNAVMQENKEIEETQKRIVDFLTEMSSQDNRGTAFPYIYTIADENYHFEENDEGEFVFENGQYKKIADIIENEYLAGNTGYCRNDENDALIKSIIERIGCYDEDGKVNEWLAEYVDADAGMAAQRYSEEAETYYEGTFFTKSDAEEYLESASNHHTKNARTYVDSMNKWGRSSKTEAFLKDLFNFFGVKIPPEMYYEKKKEAENAAEAGS